MGLGAWLIDEEERPVRLSADGDFLEKHLEDWIQADPTMIGDRVRWVARQLTLGDGTRLDLLGLAHDGTLVIVELKQADVDTGTVVQAIHYLVEIGQLSSDELLRRIRSNTDLDSSLDKELADALEGVETHERDYLIVVAGAGQGDRAEAASSFLEATGLKVPIRAISFGVVRDAEGRRILIREIDEEVAPSESDRPKRHWTVDGVRDLARDAGSLESFNLVLDELDTRDIRVWPKKTGVNLSTGGRHSAFWVQPIEDGLNMGYLGGNFPRLFGVDELDAEEALGENWINVPNEEVSALLARWTTFLDGIAARDAAAAHGD